MRPLTIICPWAKGGGTDRMSRGIAPMLAERLGQPVNVINRTGGDGVHGHASGAFARPDGYTLTMMTCELNMLHWRGLTDVDCDSFRTLLVLNRAPGALFVQVDAEWKTLEDATRAIRTSDGSLRASGSAKGSAWHVAFAGWLQAVGIPLDRVRWIPTQGAKPSLTELAAGGIDFVCCSLPEAREFLEGDLLRCLGVMNDERLPGFSDVPTFREQGGEWSLGGWRALGVPRETPDAAYDVLLATLRDIVDSAQFQEFMDLQKFRTSIEGGEVARANLAAMDEAMGELLTSEEFGSIESSPFGPWLYPSILAGALGLLTAGLCVVRWREPREVAETVASTTPRGASIGRFLLVVFLVVAYILCADGVGFVVAAAALLFLFLFALGNRIWVAIVLPLVLVPFLYQLFAVGLGVPLPRGWLGW